MSAIMERAHVAVPRAPSPRLTAAAMTFAEAESDWRAIEADGAFTPYQQFDWVRPFAEHALAANQSVRLIALKTEGGRTAAILPLVIRNRGGLRVARIIGAKHANYHMPLYAAGQMERIAHADILSALTAHARTQGGIDAYIFSNQPAAWNGAANPLPGLNALRSPSDAFSLRLEPNADATLERAMSSNARKKHRHKRSKLNELGQTRFIWAGSAPERARILAAFEAQKMMRFAEMGVANPFAEAGVMAFLKDLAAVEGGAGAVCGLEQHGEIIATFVGAVGGGRYSGMSTSFSGGGEAAKHSPGEILLVDLIRHLCGAGFTTFDLGVGEARYKSSICETEELLLDSFHPVTPAGQALVIALKQKQRLKAAVKRSPAAMGLVERLRKV
jgi:CelD/BcsL family acetyltransferase involved in cellulose biosynthesis